MSEPKAREFWIVKDGHDYYPNVFSWKAEGPLDEKRDSKIHVIEIEYEGPRGYKSLVEAHDFQVKLNKELQSLLKQAEPEFIKLSKELKSTRFQDFWHWFGFCLLIWPFCVWRLFGNM